MAEVTVTIPDPIFENVKRRAEQTGSTPEKLIMVTTILVYGPSIYNQEKWLKNQTNQDDMSQPW